MLKNNHKVIELSKGFVAIIDAEDFRRVNKHSWYAHMSAGSNKKHGQPYARSSIKGKKVYLHRFIMNAEPDMHVDHLNHQTLDNRKANLKVTTPQENLSRRRPPKCPNKFQT